MRLCLRVFIGESCSPNAMDGTEDDQMWEDDSNCDPFAGVAEDEDVDLLYVDSFEQQQAEIDPESYENLFEDSDSEDYYGF